MRALDMLYDEHEQLQGMLEILEALAARGDSGAALDPAPCRAVVEYCRKFADTCHHAKEEQLLFPLLEQRGFSKTQGPLAVMLAEHEQGRRLVGELDAAVQELAAGTAGAAKQFACKAREYVFMLRQHIAKENNVLFPMAAQMLSDADNGVLDAQFQQAAEADQASGNAAACTGLLAQLQAWHAAPR